MTHRPDAGRRLLAIDPLCNHRALAAFEIQQFHQLESLNRESENEAKKYSFFFERRFS